MRGNSRPRRSRRPNRGGPHASDRPWCPRRGAAADTRRRLARGGRSPRERWRSWWAPSVGGHDDKMLQECVRLNDGLPRPAGQGGREHEPALGGARRCPLAARGRRPRVRTAAPPTSRRPSAWRAARGRSPDGHCGSHAEVERALHRGQRASARSPPPAARPPAVRGRLAARHRGVSPHAFMVEATERVTAQSWQRAAFVAEALFGPGRDAERRRGLRRGSGA